MTVAAAALVVMAALLAFAGRSGASSNPGETVLRLTGQATSWAGFDNVPSQSSPNVPKKGFGPGDYVVYSSTVHREGSSAKLGRALGQCVRHTTPREKPELDVCTIVVRLTDG